MHLLVVLRVFSLCILWYLVGFVIYIVRVKCILDSMAILVWRSWLLFNFSLIIFLVIVGWG